MCASHGGDLNIGIATPQMEPFEKFLAGLNDATSRLISSVAVSRGDILAALAILGETCAVERVHIYKYFGSTDGGYSEQQFEWVSDPAYSLAGQADLLRTPWSGSREKFATLSRGEALHFVNPTVTEGETSIPARMGNRSALLVPIAVRGAFWGHLAFNALSDVRVWHPAEIKALATVGNAFGASVDRIDLERQLTKHLADTIVRSQRAEDRLNVLAEAMHDLLWVYDVALGRFTYLSQATEAIIGVPPSVAIGRTMAEVIALHDLGRVSEAIASEMEIFEASGAPQGHSVTIELDMIREDGGTTPIEAVAHFRRDPFSGRTEIVGTSRDVSQRRQMLAALQDSEEHYRLLAENMLDVVVRLTSGGAVIWVSPSLTEILGWQPQDWAGKDIAEFLHPDDRQCYQDVRARIALARPTVSRFRLRAVTGEYRWVEVHAKRYERTATGEVGAVASFRTVDDEVRNENELERRARIDDLTGVLNRREIFDKLGSAERARARTGTEAAVMYVDVDNLKEVNESLGHCVGDAVLQAVAARTQSALRASDEVGRVGGDEFLVLLRGIHGKEDALAIGAKVRAAVAKPLAAPGGVHTTPSVSIGIAMLDDEHEMDALIVRADEALRSAKKAGRDQVFFL